MNRLILAAPLLSSPESNVVEGFYQEHSLAENPIGRVAVPQLLRLKEVERQHGVLLPGVSRWFKRDYACAYSHFIAPAWSGGASSSRTPMWRQDAMSGNRTPAYGNADGGRTVNPYAEGSRTAYGGTTGSGGVSLFRVSVDFSYPILQLLTFCCVHSVLQPGTPEQGPPTATHSVAPKPPRTTQIPHVPQPTIALLTRPTTILGHRPPPAQQHLILPLTVVLMTPPPLGKISTLHLHLQTLIPLLHLQLLRQHQNSQDMQPMHLPLIVANLKHQLGEVKMGQGMKRALQVHNDGHKDGNMDVGIMRYRGAFP